MRELRACLRRVGTQTGTARTPGSTRMTTVEKIRPKIAAIQKNTLGSPWPAIMPVRIGMKEARMADDCATIIRAPATTSANSLRLLELGG